jgi:hypothetical protein
MAEQQMRYRYVRAFIVEGLLAGEGQEFVLSDQPGEGRKFVLTSSPDSWLTDADKSAAVGAIALSRITVAGAPPPPPPRPVSDIVNDIRLERRKRLEGRMVLVCQFEGTADAVPGAPIEKEGERFLFSGRDEINNITANHEKDIDRAIASLFAAEASVLAFEPLGVSFRIMAADGSESLAVGLGGGIGWAIARRGIDAEKVVQLKIRFEGCFRSDKDLKTVTRLLSDSLLAQNNKLRGFLAAWTSLEIFIKKFSTKVPIPPDEEGAQTRKVPALVNWFNSLCEELGVENHGAKAATFKKIKTVREQVFHYGEDMDDSSFPIEETQNLVRTFLEKIE